jgi:hypothetical protein
MAHTQLSFSVGKLLYLGIAGFLFGTAGAGLGWELSDKELIRHGRILSLLGADGARWVLIGCGLFFVLAALAALRRLAGDRTAAAIRYDGIELRGVFMSRYIPWRSLDRLSLRRFRIPGGTHYYIKAESRCPPGGNPLHHFLASLSSGVSTRLLDADEHAAARWVEEALAARPGTIAARPTTRGLRPPGPRTKVDFGRRAG